MQTLLNGMLGKLKVQIDSTEKAIGDTFNLLDKDGDGELSADELKVAITKILKRVSSEEEAKNIVQILDRDQDGKVSVIELLQYVESRKKKIEVEDFENQMKLATKDSK